MHVNQVLADVGQQAQHRALGDDDAQIMTG
jgi:hypothetical protein